MSERSRSLSVALLISLSLLFFSATPAAAQAGPSVSGSAKLSAPATLAKLLPAPAGWTKAEVRLVEAEISADCSYSSACLPLFTDDALVKVTIADTGGHPDALLALASAVVTLGETYVQEVPPATVKRFKIDQGQAVELWDAEKLAGEITVVIDGRFVVSVEAQKAASLDVLRTILSLIDLKAVAALK